MALLRRYNYCTQRIRKFDLSKETKHTLLPFVINSYMITINAAVDRRYIVRAAGFFSLSPVANSLVIQSSDGVSPFQ